MSIQDELKKLKDLFDQGLVDQEEYKEMKLNVIRSSSNTTPPPSSVIPPNLGDMGMSIHTGGVTPTAPPSGLDEMGTFVGKMDGDVVGSHRIIELLGEGGMGSVYRGRHTIEAFAEAEGDVAIKMILPSLAKDEAFKNRFIREASLGKKLNHPNIAKVVSIHSSDDVLALVMEYIEGKELKDLIPEGGLSVDEVVKLLKPMASALDYLHEQGFVHRDIKPANVRVKPDGTPVILDFGIAKDTNEVDSNMTQTGTAMGTQTYMAPEQMDAKRVTGAADQYALAMMAYQMLSGELPWDSGVSQARLGMIKLTSDYQTLIAICSVSEPQNDAVMKGLSLQPEDRYETCVVFVETLDSAPSVEQLKREAEAERLAEQERLRARQEAERLKQERLAKEARLAEEARLAKKARLAEEARLAKEARLAEEAKLAERVRLAKERQKQKQLDRERQRKAEQERLRREAERKAKEKRLEAERQRKAAQLVAQRRAEQARLEQERLAEETRLKAETEDVADVDYLVSKSDTFGAWDDLNNQLDVPTEPSSYYSERKPTEEFSFLKWIVIVVGWSVLFLCGLWYGLQSGDSTESGDYNDGVEIEPFEPVPETHKPSVEDSEFLSVPVLSVTDPFDDKIPAKITISADISAKIFIDGKLIGPAPIINKQISPGKHSVILAPVFGGMKDQKKFTIDVKPGKAIYQWSFNDERWLRNDTVRDVEKSNQAHKEMFAAANQYISSKEASKPKSDVKVDIPTNLLDIIIRNNKNVKGCYVQVRAETGTFPKSIDVMFTLQPTGKVSSASIASGPYVGSKFEGCVRAAFKGMTFPTFDKDASPQTLKYTLKL